MLTLAELQRSCVEKRSDGETRFWSDKPQFQALSLEHLLHNTIPKMKHGDGSNMMLGVFLRLLGGKVNATKYRDTLSKKKKKKTGPEHKSESIIS